MVLLSGLVNLENDIETILYTIGIDNFAYILTAITISGVLLGTYVGLNNVNKKF